jgi:hypothetical protein
MLLNASPKHSQHLSMALNATSNPEAPPRYIAYPDMAHITAPAVELGDLENAIVTVYSSVASDIQRKPKNGHKLELTFHSAQVVLPIFALAIYVFKWNGYRGEAFLPVFLRLYVFMCKFPTFKSLR